MDDRPDTLAAALEAATGQPWTWSPEGWGYVSQDNHYLLADREDGAWQLRTRPQEKRLSEWWTCGAAEDLGDFHARVARAVAVHLGVVQATEPDLQEVREKTRRALRDAERVAVEANRRVDDLTRALRTLEARIAAQKVGRCA